MPILCAHTATAAVYVELDGALDPETLIAALRDVVGRVQPTAIAGVSAPTFTFETLDLTDRDRPRAAALRWMGSLDHGAADTPDIAVHLIDLVPGHQILHLRGPGIVVDGSPGPILLHHLAVAYGSTAVAPAREALRSISIGATAAALTESFTMTTSASYDLRAFAASRGERAEAVIVAAVSGYLAAICRSAEVVLGIPATARSERGAAVDTDLPLRLTARPCATLAEHIGRTAAVVAEVHAHTRGRPPHPHRDRGPVPVIDVVPFVGAVRFGDVGGDVFTPGSAPVDDLRVTVYDAQHDRVRVDVQAHPARHTAAELRAHRDRLFDYLSRLVAAPPSMLLAGLDVISLAEHIRVVDDLNETDELLPPATLTDLLEMGIARDHDCLAVTDDPVAGSVPWALTHGELDCRANQLARVLLAAGVGSETVVGVMTADRIAGITAMLAVLRAGGAVLPLDPSHTAAVITHRIGTTRPICVVTDRVFDETHLRPDGADRSATSGRDTGYDAIPPWVEVIPLGCDDPGEMPDDPITTGELSAAGQLDNPAWIAFTDLPDAPGVVLTHRAVANRLQWLHANRAPAPGESVGLRTALASDWMWNSLLPLVVGATIDLTCASVADAVLDGPAETSFGVLPGPGEADGPDSRAWCPIWNCAVYVLDTCLRPLPAGTSGEIYVAGAPVARGYAADAAGTSERFVANPFRPGERMVRTGLSGRRNADGTLDRIDDNRSPFERLTSGLPTHAAAPRWSWR